MLEKSCKITNFHSFAQTFGIFFGTLFVADDAHDVIDGSVDTELAHIKTDVIIAGIVPFRTGKRLGPRS